MKRDADALMGLQGPPQMSLQQSLLGLRSDWFGCELLAGLERFAPALAQRLVQCNPYRENGHLLGAFAQMGVAADDTWLERHLAHRIWCESRDARWLQGATRTPLEPQLLNEAWYEETVEHPTLLVLPMTMALVDSLDMIRHVLRGRRCIVYGEGLETPQATDGIEVAGQGTRAVRRINEVLAERGVLCTYADFSYASHSAVLSTVFGRPRPISKGFVSFAQKPGVHLLPVRLAVDEAHRQCTCVFSESLSFSAAPDASDAEGVDSVVEGDPVPASDREARRQAAADVIAGLLERAIAAATWQWLLLPTLAFETHQ